MSIKPPTTAEPSYRDRFEPKNAAAIATAQKAVQALKALCPDLSIFATVLAGRTPGARDALTVIPGASTCTDGRKIFLRPDARLAGNPTDAEWSEIKAGLFHEVAHIVFDSFKAISDADRAAAIRHITESMPESLRRDALLAHLTDKGSYANYKSMSQVFHPQMPNLVNALEDARVERSLFAAKPGTQKHLEALRGKIFDAPREEIVALIGLPWNERDADSQAIIGCYLLGCGYAVEERLSDDVATILRAVEPLVIDAAEAPAVDALYARCFAVLTALQAHGLLRNHDERDEPAGETEHPEDAGAEGGPVGGVDDKCPHPKDRIVECASERCEGNCTLCGAHIVSEPSSASSEGTEGSEGTPGETGDTGKDDDAAEGDTSGYAGKSTDSAERSDPGAGGTGTDDDNAAADDDDTAEASGKDKAEDKAEEGTDGSDSASDTTDDDSDAVDSDAVDGDTDVDGDDDADSGAEADAEAEAERAEAEAERAAAETAEALEKAGGHDDPDDGMDERALEEAVSLDENGYGDERLTAGVGAIKYVPASKDTSPLLTGGRYPVNRDEAERAIATVLPEMRQMLALNGRTGFTPNMRAGRIDARSLYKTATGHTRVFGRYTSPQTRDYFFVIALDCSGSFGSERYPDMRLQKSLALTEAEMLNRLSIPFIMFGFSGDGMGGGYRLQITDIKGENEPWDERAKKRLDRLDAYQANLDGSTMQYARIRGRRACRSKSTQVVVLHHSDGGFPAENPAYEKARIQDEVRKAASRNTYFVGVGIGTSDPGSAGLDLVEVRSLTDASKVVRKMATLLGLK